MDTDRDLSVRPLAERPQYRRAAPTNAVPHVGNDTTSITHTAGRTLSRSCRIRRRTGSGLRPNWFKLLQGPYAPSDRPTAHQVRPGEQHVHYAAALPV